MVLKVLLVSAFLFKQGSTIVYSLFLNSYYIILKTINVKHNNKYHTYVYLNLNFFKKTRESFVFMYWNKFEHLYR